jgi:hypothetical protein
LRVNGEGSGSESNEKLGKHFEGDVFGVVKRWGLSFDSALILFLYHQDPV